MFVAGYYAWRADHTRLLPKLEVKDFTRQTTDTFGVDGRRNGWSEYLQLLPRCLTEANVEECRGLLTSIEMLDGFSNEWQSVEEEVMFLEWSHGDASPITLYPHAEKRLNVFFMHSSNREIRPCVLPYPVRFITLFNQLELREIKAIRFKIRLIARDCRAVGLTMKVGSARTIPIQLWSWSYNRRASYARRPVPLSLTQEYSPRLAVLASCYHPQLEGEPMGNRSGVVGQLKKALGIAQQEVQRFTAALAALGSSHSNGRPTLSAAARKRISLAQKKRWATSRKESEPAAAAAPAKRTMSASARKKIAAAQLKRWAKLRAGQKKAA
jgi:hypothetical protein